MIPRPALVGAIACAFALIVLSSAEARAQCPAGASRLGPAFAYAAGGTYPTASVIADFDGDGHPDVVTAVGYTAGSYTRGHVAFFHGVGDGTLSAAVLSPAGRTPFCLAAGDFNADGKLDLAVTNNTDSTVSILLGHGDGTFAAPVTYLVGRQPHHVVAADFNGDGILDLAIGCASEYSVAVLLGGGSGGHGDGTFGPPVRYPLNNYCTGVAVGDVNGDGIPDLVATEYTSGTVAVLPGAGDGTFGAATHVPSAGVVYDVKLADLNHDGRLDLLVCKSGEGLDMHMGHGDGTFDPATHLVDGIVGSANVADFDGDGVLDIEYSQSVANTIGVLQGLSSGGVNTGAFAPEIERAAGPFPALSTAGDLNGDGVADVAVGAYTGTQVVVCVSSCGTEILPFAIDHVRDVPNDQGGRVWVTWGAHVQDAVGGAVTGYRVWRRIPAAVAATRPAGTLRATRAAAGTVYWEAAASLPAQRLAAYGYTAATPQDSMADSNPYTAFFITATTANPDVFYDTAVDSGYSVDNLAPAAPAQVQEQVAGGGVSLTWRANDETDLAGYLVYRGSDRFFVPSAANLAGGTALTAYHDPGGAGFWYKLAAVDRHGNASPYVLVEPAGATGVDLSLVSLDATPTGVTLTWYADAHAIPFAALERSRDDGVWAAIASGSPDGGGRLVFRDADVVPGGRYAYRLAWSDANGEHASPEQDVTIPGLALALHGAWPNPARGGALAIRFTLPDGAPASLALFDVSGRRVVQREVGVLGAGAHVVALDGAHLPPGVYLARLEQHGQARQARVVIAP